MRTRAKALFFLSKFSDAVILSFSRFAELEAGVGGLEGIRRAGKHAAHDYNVSALVRKLECQSTYNNRREEDHVRYIFRLCCPEGTNKLTERTTKRISQRGYSCSRDTTKKPLLRKPKITVASWCSQNEWLSESNDDLA
jgi:hypothetical protein